MATVKSVFLCSQCLSHKYGFALCLANMKERQTWKNADSNDSTAENASTDARGTEAVGRAGRRAQKRRTQNGTAATLLTREEVTEAREEGEAIERERRERQVGRGTI